MKLRFALALCALAAPAFAQSLPTPNLGCAFKVNGTTVGCPHGVPVGGTGVATITGIVKGNGTSPFSAAVAGTDFLAPTGNGSGLIGLLASQIGSVPTGLLKGSGGAFAAAVAGTDYLAPSGNGSALTGLTASQITDSTSVGRSIMTAANAAAVRTAAGVASAGTKGTGTSVADPGTGNLEALLPVQTITGASRTFVAGDLYQETRRSNSGSAMTDTFPGSATTGLVNGTMIQLNNVDTTASLTLSAGTGTTLNGNASVTIPPSRSTKWVYDAPSTVWRTTMNSLSGVNGPSSVTSGNAASFNGTTGTLIQDSGKALPSGTIVGTSDTQTLTNKSIDASEVNSGTLVAARMPALTGSCTTTAGTVAVTCEQDGAAASYTPTLSCASGSFGAGATATGFSKTIGTKLLWVQITISFGATGLGTCQFPQATVPVNARNEVELMARENAILGTSGTGRLFAASNIVRFSEYAGGAWAGNNYVIVGSGIFETQ